MGRGATAEQEKMRINEHQASEASSAEGAGQLFNKIISDFMMLSTNFRFLILQLSKIYLLHEKISKTLLVYHKIQKKKRGNLKIIRILKKALN
ncbi:MAG: hypothetical protein Q4E94_01075 [Clostridia bacterium]|nr:hypothetical protein [Clostridia bacterium]